MRYKDHSFLKGLLGYLQLSLCENIVCGVIVV